MVRIRLNHWPATALVTAILVGGASHPIALARTNVFIDDACHSGLSNDGLFWAAGPAVGWHVQSYGPSPGDCHLWVYSRQAPYVNSAYWYLPLNANNSGTFNVAAFIPCVNHGYIAHYQTYPYGTAQGWYNFIYLDQRNYCDGYAHLITRYFSQADPTAGYMKFDDASGTYGYRLAVDQMRYLAQ